MASFFTLELDTTPPSVEIYAPTYTVKGISNDIEVVSNEELSLYQEIYIIDSLGIKHDLIFSHQTDRFEGIVNFDSYPLGSATIYAKLKDTVSNESVLINKAIEIISDVFAFRLSVDMSNRAMGVGLSNSRMEIEVSDITRSVVISDLTRSVILSNE